MAKLELSTDVAGAIASLERSKESIQAGGAETVNQLSVLAENAMKAEAPEGAGVPTVHMRSTIDTTYTNEGMRGVTMPHKRTSGGWLLHRAIVGNPSTPTYTGAKPPVWPGPDGDAQGPLAEWADAKLGNRNIAWALRNSIAENGHDSFPNRFIDRSIRRWQGQVNRIADSTISSALRGD